MNFDKLIGQVIDGKYSIESQLGKGGMGTVYLATHIGTERPVAVKVIAPQFMERAEFVERFRREARAAGRLRHPNVVDVTDFGIADAGPGKIAYLVMEYLDGCTLGEILEEEKQLPLMWSLDILEQVCSAVHAAHEEGIIHRDLKPDNIWLEPNQRGGYTVKVLDFGIAKLEGHAEPESSDIRAKLPDFSSARTVADTERQPTVADARGATMISEKGTAIFDAGADTQTRSKDEVLEKSTAILQTPQFDLEAGTAILEEKGTKIISEDDGTRIIGTAADTERSSQTSSTSDLTRVGAVLGTPLYMSPEQCRGERLSPHSDIYSLGVIAYQMLGGKTPFEGEFTGVMLAHKETPPPALVAKKVPKKVKKVILDSLAKNIADRPPTAQAFASQLRASSEGIGELLTRSMVLYSEHLPKFLLVSFLIMIPHIVLTLSRATMNLARGLNVLPEGIWVIVVNGLIGFFGFFVQIFSSALIVGVITWLVAHILAVPLRPVNVRAAFKKVRERWKTLAKTVTISTLLAMFGMIFCFIPGIWLSARYMLIAPSIMMEGATGRGAFRRSVELVKRSYRTVLATAILVYFVPVFFVLAIAVSAQLVARDLIPDMGGSSTVAEKKTEPEVTAASAESTEPKTRTTITVNGHDITGGKEMTPEEREKKVTRERREAIANAIFEVIWLPLTVLITSFTSVITALLYFKTRQAGGESMQDLLEQFEERDSSRSKWQERVQNRLVQSARITTGKS